MFIMAGCLAEHGNQPLPVTDETVYNSSMR